MSRIEGQTALVLGGAGLVGQAVCRSLSNAGIATILVGGLTEQEARQAVAELDDVAFSTELIPVWGDIFVRAEYAHEHPTERARQIAARDRILSDDLDELSEEIYRASHLVQLVLGTSPLAQGKAPHIVVDAINTATALAYTGIYSRLRDILDLRRQGDPESLVGQLDALLASFATPRLVRHMQLLSRAMEEAGTETYVKVGTTGTGGMGLNIPYTHGEERPSRVLLSKSALAGAHSMLLFLLSRTPGAPAVKEIKPAAAITWKRIAHGPIRHRGQAMPLYDCPPDQAVRLTPGAPLPFAEAGERIEGQLESVFIDTGENGLFSIGEFTAITALGQMEAVTPQDIATLVVREIQGKSTGRDVIAALDGAVTGPSYRAGILRQRAIDEARALAERHDATSVAFELLGPPRLSKLLYEAELLKRAMGSLESVAAATPSEIADAMLAAVQSETELRRAAITVGIPVLMPSGDALLFAGREHRKHRWEQPGWHHDPSDLERWAHSEWIDLRRVNAERWRDRARAIVASKQRDADDASRASDLDRRFAAENFEIGETAAWILEHEDQGFRHRA